jgi:hypothetical protein
MKEDVYKQTISNGNINTALNCAVLLDIHTPICPAKDKNCMTQANRCGNVIISKRIIFVLEVNFVRVFPKKRITKQTVKSSFLFVILDHFFYKKLYIRTL